MSQITVTIHGADVLQSGLKKLGLAVSNMPAKVIRPEMEQAGTETSGGYSGGNSYTVPERPGQDYVRTGTYGSRTRVVPGDNNQYLKSYKLESGASYSRHVGGDAYGQGQAWMHRGRWPLMVNAVEAALDRIVEKANQMFSDVISRTMGGL